MSLSDASGDKAYLTWKCEGDTVHCMDHSRTRGGTGKYSSISGQNTFSATTEVNWQDGTATGFATWNR
jgi:hypothetical protein